MEKVLADRQVKKWMRQKAAVEGSQVTDFASSGMVNQNAAFLASLEHGPGLLDKIYPSARFGPYKTRTGVPSSPTVANTVVEGASIPVTNFSMSFDILEATKAAALAVASNDVLRADSRGVDTLYTDLKEGLTLASDARCIAILKAGLVAITSAGTPSLDFALLLDVVNKTGFANLLALVSPKLANSLACWEDATGLRYPDMTPTGGIACGVAVHVSAAMSETEMLLIDIKGLLVGPQEIDLQEAPNALVEMSDNPAMESLAGTSAAGNMVSMFQTDSTAFRATRHFGLKVVRASAVALVDSIAWELES